MDRKKILIVFAHEDAKSFNGAIKDVTVDTLISAGHDVEVSDLYAMGFNPVVSPLDVTGTRLDDEHFRADNEMANAFKTGTIADDLKLETQKVQKADLIIFQYPLYWHSMPAIMKGWTERVLANGFAFSFEGEQWYDKGHMRDKRALLSFTSGCPEDWYKDSGLAGDINVMLWPIQSGILAFCGFNVLAPNICYCPSLASDEDRKRHLQSWSQRLKTVFEEKTLTMIPLDNFDQQGKLTDSFIESHRKTSDCGLSVGQNIGQRLPRNSMACISESLLTSGK